MHKHQTNLSERHAQHLLAVEVLELVHGMDVAQQTQLRHRSLRQPDAMFSASATDSNGHGGTADQRVILPRSLVLHTPFPKILYHAGMASTKSEAARIIRSGGAYVAVPKQAEENTSHFMQITSQTSDDVPSYTRNSTILLRLGKWKVRLIEIVEDDEFDKRGLDAPGWSEFKARKIASDD